MLALADDGHALWLSLRRCASQPSVERVRVRESHSQRYPLVLTLAALSRQVGPGEVGNCCGGANVIWKCVCVCVEILSATFCVGLAGIYSCKRRT